MLWWWKRKLQNGDPVVRLRAVEKIAAHGADGIEYLRQAAKDPDDDVAACAVDRLGWLRDAMDVTPLLEKYSRDAYPYELETIVRGVGRTGDPAAVQGLWQVIRTCHMENQRSNLEILTQALCNPKGEAALVGLLESDEEDRILGVLTGSGSNWRSLTAVQNWIERLHERVATGDGDAARTLGWTDCDWKTSGQGKAAIDGLLSLLDGAKEERSRAVSLLSEMYVSEGIAPLIRVLASADAGSEERVQIAYALAGMGTPRAMLDLMEALAKNDELARCVTEERLGQAEMHVLSQMAHGQVPVTMTATLARQVLDENRFVQQCALAVLEGAGELWAESESNQGRIVELLRNLGVGGDVEVVASDLGFTGDKAAVPVLQVALESATAKDDKMAIIQALKDLDETQVSAKDLAWYEEFTAVLDDETETDDSLNDEVDTWERVDHLSAVLRGETGMRKLTDSSAMDSLSMLGDIPAGAEVNVWVPGGTTLKQALDAADELAGIGTAAAINALIDAMDVGNPQLTVSIAKKLADIAPKGTWLKAKEVVRKLEGRPSGMAVAECRGRLKKLFKV